MMKNENRVELKNSAVDTEKVSAEELEVWEAEMEVVEQKVKRLHTIKVISCIAILVAGAGLMGALEAVVEISHHYAAASLNIFIVLGMLWLVYVVRKKIKFRQEVHTAHWLRLEKKIDAARKSSQDRGSSLFFYKINLILLGLIDFVYLCTHDTLLTLSLPNIYYIS